MAEETTTRFRVDSRVHDQIRRRFIARAARRRDVSRSDAAEWFDEQVSAPMLAGLAAEAGVKLLASGATEGAFIDWLKTVDWAKVLEIVMQLLAMFMAFA